MARFIPWMLLLLPGVELLVVPMLAAADDSGGALSCLHAVQADENAKLATGVCSAVAVGPVSMPVAGAATVGSTDGGIAEVADAFGVQERFGDATTTLIKDHPTQDGAVRGQVADDVGLLRCSSPERLRNPGQLPFRHIRLPYNVFLPSQGMSPDVIDECIQSINRLLHFVLCPDIGNDRVVITLELTPGSVQYVGSFHGKRDIRNSTGRPRWVSRSLKRRLERPKLKQPTGRPAGCSEVIGPWS